MPRAAAAPGKKLGEFLGGGRDWLINCCFSVRIDVQ
jgi:hypothetical protein